MTRFGLISVLIVIASLPLTAQEPVPRFEVASVRLSDSGGSQGGISRPVNGVVRVNRAPLRRIIQFAYDIEPVLRHDPEPVGGPSWIDNELFVIEARGPVDLTLPDARRMMQSLLRERFNLRVRMERGDVPVYTLVVARSDGAFGVGLRRSKTGCRAFSEALARSGRLEVARQVGPKECGFDSGGLGGGRLFLKGTGTISDMLRSFARSPDVDRKIIDRTGLSGTFEVDLTWAPDRFTPASALPERNVVSLFTTLQEVGLKLEPSRGAVEVVIIDSVDRPTPN